MDQVRSGMLTCTRSDEVGEDWREYITMNVRTGASVETVYLTQWIRVGSKPQLVMYDRGSNTNLIAGRLAQAGNMKIIFNKPRKMTVAGGQTLSTKYGLYIEQN